MTTRQIDPLIGAIYDAVTALDGFQGFVERLADVFDLKAAMLFTHNVLNGEAKGMWQFGMDRRWIDSYAMEYGPEDQLAQLLTASVTANFYASNLHLSADDYLTSRFYREWIVPQGVRYAAGAVILREGVWATQVVLQRSVRQSPFIEDELALLGQLVTHLQRAVQMRHRFLELQMGETLLTAGLDVVAVPSIMLDEWGCVFYANQAANTLIETRNGLWVEDRHLCTAKLALTKQISLEVMAAIDVSRGRTGVVPGIIAIPRQSLSPLTLMILPMRAAKSGMMGAAIAFVYDPSAVRSVDPKVVERLFCLTSAEAELAVSLCNGNTLEEAALARHTSVHTVRSQLKSIFGKTGTRRQADLLGLVLSSPAYFVTRVVE